MEFGSAVGAPAWRVMLNRYADAVDWLDHALNLPGADAHPALRVRALRTKARCLWQIGRGAEQPAVVAALEEIARRLGDPDPRPRSRWSHVRYPLLLLLREPAIRIWCETPS